MTIKVILIGKFSISFIVCFTREIFVDPLTNDVLKEGDIFTWPNLAETLKRIAEFGAGDFYTGQIAKDLVKDLEVVGSIITLEDLKNYK